MDLKKCIREIEDFPKPGIGFKDITTILLNPEAMTYTVDEMVNKLNGVDYDVIVGPEARGFIFGTPVAYATKKPFAPIRKPGKLPAEVESYSYTKEYGEDTLEIHKDAIKPGDKVVLIDDLLATGGTISAVTKLIEQLGGEVVKIFFLIELSFLGGRDLLTGYDVESLVTYDE